MGRRIRNPEWARLQQPVVAALDRWLEGQDWDLGLRRWFDDGLSGAEVALVTRTGANRDDQVVIKFFLAGPAEVRRWKDAVRGAGEYADRHLVKLVDDGPLGPDPDGPWLAVLRIAGGDLVRFRPLQQALRSGDGSAAETLRTVVSSVLLEWYVQPPVPPATDRTASDYLRSLFGAGWLDERLSSGAPLRAWMDRQGIALDAPVVDRPDPLANPVALAVQPGLTDGSVHVFHGKCHGDLQVRNVYLPIEPADPNQYRLIDLGGYAAAAPLARDPMHLLLSVALEWLRSGIRPASPTGRTLIEAIVPTDPTKVPDSMVAYHEVSRAIRECRPPRLEEDGWGADWTGQQLLALAGCGLLFAGRRFRTDGAAVEDLRGWFFDLAAVAARAYLIHTEQWAQFQRQARTTAPATPMSAASAQMAGADVLPFRRSEQPTPQWPPPRHPADSWAELRHELSRVNFGTVDWRILAARTERLRVVMTAHRDHPDLAGTDIADLLEDLEVTIVEVLTPAASPTQLRSAAEHATRLRSWLLDSLE